MGQRERKAFTGKTDSLDSNWIERWHEVIGNFNKLIRNIDKKVWLEEEKIMSLVLNVVSGADN